MLGLEHIQNSALIPNGWIWLIPAFPLLGAVLNGLFVLFFPGRKTSFAERIYSVIGCGASVFSFLAAFLVFLQFKNLHENVCLVQDLFDWIEAGGFHVRLNLQLDSLSIVMAVFITFVSSLIHLYSVGYMKGDEGFGRYFVFLNLFLFSMLVLVMAENLLVLFLGWEGVGFCSYILISFWFEDKAKADAGKKAIILNRIGDAGFLAGLLIVYGLTGTLDFNDLQAHKMAFNETMATLACLCFFFGAAGKSAQIPLYVWLPDAMAGPTPVSALIHAATMVTAGVYLVARLHFLYVLAPWASMTVAVIGLLTALLAGTIALGQNDIKKILAYSTISQLGFMFLGAGVGAYSAGMFHLITHGFSKACLFLGAGSVIHVLKGEQDIRKMGGLLKHVPLTSVSFLIGWLSLTGLLPFCGSFFSKDEILWRTLATPNSLVPGLPEVLYFGALTAAFLTAFYLTRLVVLVFLGEFKGTPEMFEQMHESPRAMVIPLFILALGSIFVGWIGVPEGIGGENPFNKFLEPLFRLSSLEPNALSPKVEPLLMLLSFLVAGLGAGAAWYVYGLKHNVSARILKLIPGGKKAIEQKYYVDKIYEMTVIKWVKSFANVVSNRIVEQLLINRMIDAAVRGFYGLAKLLRGFQVGLIRVYLLYIAIGAALLIYMLTH